MAQDTVAGQGDDSGCKPGYDFPYSGKFRTEKVIRVHPFRYQEDTACGKCYDTECELEEAQCNLFLFGKIVCLGDTAVFNVTDAAVDVPDAFRNLGSGIQQPDAT